MRLARVASLFVLLLASGCTGIALEESVLSQGKSITYIQQEMVLDNLEMFRQTPDVKPWHIKITSGVVSVNDEVTPSAMYAWSPALTTLGLTATRSVQLQWSVLPVTNPALLNGLKSLYQANARVPPAPGRVLGVAICPELGFDQIFEEGPSPPPLGPHGSYAGINIWVRNDPKAKACFAQILDVIIGSAPVTAADLSTPIPGAFPLIARRP